MAGGFLESYYGPTRKKQARISETSIDTIAGVMLNVMIYTVEQRLIFH